MVIELETKGAIGGNKGQGVVVGAQKDRPVGHRKDIDAFKRRDAADRNSIPVIGIVIKDRIAAAIADGVNKKVDTVIAEEAVIARITVEGTAAGPDGDKIVVVIADDVKVALERGGVDGVETGVIGGVEGGIIEIGADGDGLTIGGEDEVGEVDEGIVVAEAE